MSDAVWKRGEVESPCVKLCTIHPETRLCLGCARSMDEIAAWGRMSAEERRAIMDDLPHRQAAPTARRGGRKARLKD
ncbi:hypothetical protein FHS00_000573 [Limimaricola variabilis]|jgi:predicted Fe-S protein YdhL (DUF1289 family)|uniref:DUF1289 domain-containing protein n=1 Tax=Limimaricola variabilis TaxID=1492771 RepID=A0ABR6HKR2_9RHOB|nr:DUF1289 domain-containing protein [Limimaricola variabilis]MBB3711020.1 hypothetical protein [Limimaricola variabilis]WPY95569.1 DUF1289 domain-containing protein [Limimaricola variabilis]